MSSSLAMTLERLVSTLMFVSVRLSTLSLAGGLALYLARPDGAAAAWLLHAGIVLLMATPLLRVLVAAAEAARTRDRLLVGMIVAVAVLLLLTLALASRG